ncbi:glutathione S-transferase family protein [Thalassotalea piscium]|uniref:Glutathione S-transferase n=1 Tax=Thalassotalea piscium TaxID=1230533 RepID=A0A7X0TS35_9GAMM|nr:glutathione S-transferase family protein [Thalassotalea piscium]MBB6541726.1 glutathione S-transferase [Thalassotalea piscium]
MKLYGSTSSPYVRRIRLYLIKLSLEDTAVEFINLDIFNQEDRALLTASNPAQKIPALIDNELCIYDSRVIYRYLAEKYQQPSLTWQQENLLTLIDAANDSMVSMLQLTRSGVDVNQDSLFFNLQRERVEQVMNYLNKSVENGEFTQWNYVAICLFCLLDWLAFRSLYNWEKYSDLKRFYERVNTQLGVNKTDPRLA